MRSRTGFCAELLPRHVGVQEDTLLAGAVNRGIDHRPAQIVAGGHLERGVEIADQQVAPMGPVPASAASIWASR